MLKRLLCDYSGRSVEYISVVAGINDSFLGITQKRFRRRTMVSPIWQPPKTERVYSALNENDRKLMGQLLKNTREPTKKAIIRRQLPFTDNSNIPDCGGNTYSFNSSKRIGLIGRKIGMTLQWLTNGTRVLCTLIHIPENHVLQVIDPETWFKRNVIGKRKSFGIHGPRWNVLIGSNNVDSIFFTDAYRRIFERYNIPIKEHIAGFICSEDALVNPGTKLDVRHFNIGQYVTVSGKSIDWGFQGVMHRWGMKGQPNKRTTKSHRRVGSIGSKGEGRVWPGRRLPGHMGYEWNHAHSLQILRINPIKQVMYVKGCVPGDVGETVLIKDEMIEERRVTDPPFPTFLPTIEEAEKFEDAELKQIHMVTSKDVCIPQLFRFNQPSIEYTEADETKLTARDKSKAKLAKVKK